MTRRLRLAGLDELPPGDMLAVWVAEVRMEVLLANVDGSIFAMDNVCSHSGGSLADGLLQGSTVTCPLHGWQYDVTTGVCPHIPDERLATFPAAIENGQVMVELP